jgi:hypothetical protein
MTTDEYQGWELGMREAMKICSQGPLNPGVKRTLEDESVRTLFQAYQQGQNDSLADVCDAIEQRIAVVRKENIFP